MNSDGSQIDALDVVIKIGILLCFVAFAICMWLLKRERNKRKKSGGQMPGHQKNLERDSECT